MFMFQEGEQAEGAFDVYVINCAVKPAEVLSIKISGKH